MYGLTWPAGGFVVNVGSSTRPIWGLSVNGGLLFEDEPIGPYADNILIRGTAALTSGEENWTAGDTLYLTDDLLFLTNEAPTASPVYVVGTVLEQLLNSEGDPSGSYLVHWIGDGSTRVSDCIDVDFTTAPPEDGQALIWDEDTETWIPGEAGGIPTDPVAANLVLGGPASGDPATPAFRALVTADLPASGVLAGNYGDKGNVPKLTIDAKGRITAATTDAIPAATDNGSGTPAFGWSGGSITLFVGTEAFNANKIKSKSVSAVSTADRALVYDGTDVATRKLKIGGVDVEQTDQGWVIVTNTDGTPVATRNPTFGKGEGVTSATRGSLKVVLSTDGDYIVIDDNLVAIYKRSISTETPMIKIDLDDVASWSTGKAMSIREVDVCDGGAAKKMLILASAPYTP
jgi:hypothetical protein